MTLPDHSSSAASGSGLSKSSLRRDDMPAGASRTRTDDFGRIVYLLLDCTDAGGGDMGVAASVSLRNPASPG